MVTTGIRIVVVVVIVVGVVVVVVVVVVHKSGITENELFKLIHVPIDELALAPVQSLFV